MPRSALIIIDLINDFVTGKFGNPRAQAVVLRTKELLQAVRSKRIRVIYVTDAHLPGIDQEFEVWGTHAEKGSEGAEVVPELEPMENEIHLYKRRYSAFYATGLDAILRELKIKELVLAGVLTNICIQHTAADAFFRGYQVIIPVDCVDSLTDEGQEYSLNYIDKMYNADITTSDEYIRKLGALQ
jgi:nicotinamidase-related amidase